MRHCKGRRICPISLNTICWKDFLDLSTGTVGGGTAVNHTASGERERERIGPDWHHLICERRWVEAVSFNKSFIIQQSPRNSWLFVNTTGRGHHSGTVWAVCGTDWLTGLAGTRTADVSWIKEWCVLCCVVDTKLTPTSSDSDFGKASWSYFRFRIRPTVWPDVTQTNTIFSITPTVLLLSLVSFHCRTWLWMNTFTQISYILTIFKQSVLLSSSFFKTVFRLKSISS